MQHHYRIHTWNCFWSSQKMKQKYSMLVCVTKRHFLLLLALCYKQYFCAIAVVICCICALEAIKNNSFRMVIVENFKQKKKTFIKEKLGNPQICFIHKTPCSIIQNFILFLLVFIYFLYLLCSSFPSKKEKKKSKIHE